MTSLRSSCGLGSPVALEPRGRVDQRLAQAPHARAQETGRGRPATDPPRAGVEGLAQRHPGNRDQTEPVDGPVVSTDGQPSAVLTEATRSRAPAS